FGTHGAGAASRRCRAAAYGQRSGGAGGARQPAALFQLADVSAAVPARRAARWLRAHPGRAGVRGIAANGQRRAVASSPLELPVAAAPPLAGRVVLVAGAPGGLGAAAARACATAGATLVLLGRRLPRLNRIYDAVARLGPEPLLYPLDLEGASPDDY